MSVIEFPFYAAGAGHLQGHVRPEKIGSFSGTVCILLSPLRLARGVARFCALQLSLGFFGFVFVG